MVSMECKAVPSRACRGLSDFAGVDRVSLHDVSRRLPHPWRLVRRVAFLSVLAIGLVGCKPDYLPLKVGRRWTLVPAVKEKVADGDMEAQFTVLGSRQSDDGTQMYSVKRTSYFQGNAMGATYFRYEVSDHGISSRRLDAPDPTGSTVETELLLRFPIAKGTTWLSEKDTMDWVIQDADSTVKTRLGLRDGCVEAVGASRLSVCDPTLGAPPDCSLRYDAKTPRGNYFRWLRQFCPGLGMVREAMLTLTNGRVANVTPIFELSSVE